MISYEMRGGGAGNPGGLGYYASNGATGTGGLLIIFSRDLNNMGKMTAEGSAGGAGQFAGGGASGGGSVNLFYKNLFTKGTITTTGGTGGDSWGFGNGGGNGGNGGNGCITIGNISTGTFVKDE